MGVNISIVSRNIFLEYLEKYSKSKVVNFSIVSRNIFLEYPGKCMGMSMGGIYCVLQEYPSKYFNSIQENIP